LGVGAGPDALHWQGIRPEFLGVLAGTFGVGSADFVVADVLEVAGIRGLDHGAAALALLVLGVALPDSLVAGGREQVLLEDGA
jgi:hypothetical protein